MFIAVEALRRSNPTKSVDVKQATTWHESLGGVNGGTIHTVVDMPLGLNELFRGHLLDDPLALAHPDVKSDPAMEETRKRLAVAEWKNQLPSADSIMRLGWSVPFFMAPVNAKIVQASAIALKYGRNFVYRERFCPLGYLATTHMNVLTVIPAAISMIAVSCVFAILKLPVIGRALANWLIPPGTGCSDQSCRTGYAHVYAEVATAPNDAGGSDKASCLVKFKGDPGNWVTAQCVSEAALTLLLNRDDLPSRSKDGFGTPVELLGEPLLHRLQNTSVRPVVVEIHVRLGVGREWKMHPEVRPYGPSSA